MADERKRFIIQTIYDSRGVKEYKRDLETARGVSRRFGVELSDSAKILEQSTSRSFTSTGERVVRTTALIQDKGNTLKVVYDKLANSTRFVSTSFVGFRDRAAILGAELGKLVARAGLVIPVWLALRAAFTGLQNTIANGIKFLSDWEFQMAQIKIVSFDSAKSIQENEREVRNLGSALLNLSRTLGISNKDIGEGAKLYVQQGRAIKDILPLMDATAKLSLLTGQSVTQSVEDLTAILKAYKFEVQDAIRVVDALTNVELVHAVTTDDLTEALKEVASTASTTGVSFESLVGFITAVKSETRDTANRVGLSLRTMFARLTTSSAEALQTLTGVPFFLDQTGEATTQVTPVMRNLESVISELAIVFRTLTNAQKAQVADLVGGTNRLNEAFALFNNFNEAIEAQADALFSLSKSDEAISILSDTLQQRVRKLQSAWEQFVATVADTSAIKGATGTLTSLIEGATAIVNPDEAFRNGLLGELTQSQQKANQQQSFANSLLEVKKKAEDLAKVVERNPKALEQAKIETAIWATKINQVGQQFGITIDESVKLPGDLAAALNQQLSQIQNLSVSGALDSIRKDIQTDMVNISTDIRKIIGQRFQGSGLLGEGSFGGKGEGIFDGLLTAGMSKELAEARRIFINFQKGLFISPEQGDKLKATFKNLLNKDDFAEFSGLVDKLTSAQNQINNLEGRRSELLDANTKKLKEQNQIQQTSSLTEEQIELRLRSIEQQSIVNNTDRLAVINSEISLLKAQGATLVDTLKTRLENLETEKLTLETSRKRSELESRQNIAINALKNSGASNLQILVQELAFLEQINAQEDLRLKKREEIAIESQNLQKSITEEILGAELDLLKARGASDLQVLRTNIELEKRLGLEKTGLDGLKQQLDLLKAIGKEQQKSKEERIKDLQAAVKQREKTADPFGFREVQQGFQEQRATQEAKRAGFTDKEINTFLRPEETLKSELPQSIQLLSKENDNLGQNIFRLASTIDNLSDRIFQEESRPLDLSRVRPLLNENLPTNPAVLQSSAQKQFVLQQPSPLAPKIDISDGAIRIQLEVNTTGDLENALNEAFKDISKRVAQQMTTSGTDLNKAFRHNFERE